MLHSCISGNFMAGSWSQTSSAFQVGKICGDSAETKKKTYDLCILYISCGRFYWGFATRIPQQKPPPNFAILFGGGGRAGGRQWGANMELGNSWRYMGNVLLVAKTLTYCMVWFAIKRSKWMQHLILGPSSLRECGNWISPREGIHSACLSLMAINILNRFSWMPPSHDENWSFH